MTDPRLEDHLLGLELQLVEVVERKERALVQGRQDDAAGLTTEIEALQSELGSAAEELEDTHDESATVSAPAARTLARSGQDPRSARPSR